MLKDALNVWHVGIRNAKMLVQNGLLNFEGIMPYIIMDIMDYSLI